MAKLNRESKLRERRLNKQARKEARKQAPPDHGAGAAGAAASVQPGAEQALLQGDEGQP